MTEDNTLSHTEQAMAYYGGDLSPEEQAAFEAHLAGCEECQKLLAEARRLLPAAEAMLAFKPKYTVEEQVQRFDQIRQMRRELEEGQRRQRPWRIATYALAAFVAALLLYRAIVVRPHEVPSPVPPAKSAKPMMLGAPVADRDGGASRSP
jgi:anti-sigma factor RsiW